MSLNPTGPEVFSLMPDEPPMNPESTLAQLRALKRMATAKAGTQHPPGSDKVAALLMAADPEIFQLPNDQFDAWLEQALSNQNEAGE